MTLVAMHLQEELKRWDGRSVGVVCILYFNKILSVAGLPVQSTSKVSTHRIDVAHCTMIILLYMHLWTPFEKKHKNS